MNTQQFQQSLEERGITLTSEQLDQLEAYYRLLVEWNEKMNLTAITEHDEVFLKHFYDSISAAFYFDFTKPMSICDVGAGAGFPSIPIKIIYPHLKVSIVDSLNKRIGFLEHLASELNLTDTSFYHDRAETFGTRPEQREQYDVVMARAVARMSVLSELCLPLVKVNGAFVAMKGANLPEELKEARKAIDLLGGTIKYDHHFQLPFDGGDRHIVVIDKNKKTPKKYPRKPGTPNKSPII